MVMEVFVKVVDQYLSIQLGRTCSRYQFECHTTFECIAIYNACDGIIQCSDGSDEAPELGCPAASNNVLNRPTIIKVLMTVFSFYSNRVDYDQIDYIATSSNTNPS